MTALLLALAFALATDAGPPADPGARAVLVTALQTPAKKAGAELRIVLRNTGSQTLWVNRRFTLESETCRTPRASVRIVVSDARNRRVPSTCSANPGPPRREDYAVLAPGRELTSTVDLFCYHFETGERLRLDAVYWDPADPVPPPPPGAVHLHDRLNARPLTFVAP
jgi:hypothetical protein